MECVWGVVVWILSAVYCFIARLETIIDSALYREPCDKGPTRDVPPPLLIYVAC